jgi:hypothetical protein
MGSTVLLCPAEPRVESINAQIEWFAVPENELVEITPMSCICHVSFRQKLCLPIHPYSIHSTVRCVADIHLRRLCSNAQQKRTSGTRLLHNYERTLPFHPHTRTMSRTFLVVALTVACLCR